MATWWQRLFSRDTENSNLLTESVQPETEVITKSAHILDNLEKEARSFEINPQDHANYYLAEAYDGNGKKYFFDEHRRDELSMWSMKELAKHHIIASIIGARVNQVAEFAQFSNDDDLGYRIVMKDPEAEVTEDDKLNMRALNNFLQNCGTTVQDYELTFEAFLRQIVRDSLVYDACCFEIIKNRKGQVTGFIPVDATTIRRAKMSKEEVKRGRKDPSGTRYLQVINQKVVAEYKQDELCFGIRRPRTDLGARGYGHSELYELYGTLNNLFNAETYNGAHFTNGINANGIIAVKSKMDPKLFRSFRREFYQMLNGTANAKRTPLIQLDPEENEAIQSISLGSSNREMEYQNWVNYLIKVTCAVYQIDPAEIGFVFGNEMQSSTVFAGDPTSRVLMGKEKGLRPLIRSLQTWINRYIIDQIDDRYQLVFVGFDSVSPIDKMKLEKHRMDYLTLNEIRAQHDLEEIDDGNIIASAYSALKVAILRGRQGIALADAYGRPQAELDQVIQEEHERKLELEGYDQPGYGDVPPPPHMVGKNVKDVKDVFLDALYKEEYSQKELQLEIDKAKKIKFDFSYLDDIDWSKFSDDDAVFEVPDELKEIAQNILDLREEHGDEVRGGTRVGWGRATQLANGEKLSLNIVERMYSFWVRHKKNGGVKEEWKDTPWKDNGWTAIQIWGGHASGIWAEKLLYEVDQRMEKE